MEPTSAILTNLLNQFNAVFKAAGAGIVSDATGLLGLLVGLELVIAGLYWAASGNEFIPQLVWKIVRIGLFGWFVTRWSWLIDVVLKGFVYTGAHAGGSGSVTKAFTDPSSIIDMAGQPLSAINDEIILLSKGAGVLTNFGQILLFDLAYDLVFIAFGIIAIQVFVTGLEFGIVSTLAVILVPFGVFRPMAFLAEKSFGVVIGFGVRVMTLAFILGASFTVLSTANLPPNPTIDQAMFLVLGAAAVGFLSWHGPSVAASMMSGGPSLSAGTVGAAGMAAGLAAVGTVQAARMVAEGGAAMANQIFSAAKGGSGGGGAASTIAAASPAGGGAPGAAGAGGGAPDAAALRSRMEQSFNASGGQSAGGSNAGAAGAAGAAGVAGAEGTAGTTGTAGSAGASGSTGAAGGSGVSGSSGSAGADGGSGSAGAAGSGGSDGTAGAAGAAGEGDAAGGANGSQSSPSSFAGETATTRDPGNGWNSREPSDTPQRPDRQSSKAGSTLQKAIETGMREESPSQGASPSLNGGEA